MLSVDFYINETTRYADLILPPTAPLEHDHYDSTFNLLAVRNVTRFNRPVLAKPDGTLDDWEIFVGLAKAYAAQGRQALQHLALAEAYALKGALPAALDQLQIARRASDASFYDQSIIDAREREFQERRREELKESKEARKP